ncbi:MAG: hypothetical protein U5L09_16945 [Bacteroidales bacterium]|nr:hypothetical protein [Bacteroidales bacterium]
MTSTYIVYKRLQDYCEEKGYEAGTMYEVYDDKQQRIFYHLNIKDTKDLRGNNPSLIDFPFKRAFILSRQVYHG